MYLPKFFFHHLMALFLLTKILTNSSLALFFCQFEYSSEATSHIAGRCWTLKLKASVSSFVKHNFRHLWSNGKKYVMAIHRTWEQKIVGWKLTLLGLLINYNKVNTEIKRNTTGLCKTNYRGGIPSICGHDHKVSVFPILRWRWYNFLR